MCIGVQSTEPSGTGPEVPFVSSSWLLALLWTSYRSTKLGRIYCGYVGSAHILRSLRVDAVELEARSDRSCTNMAVDATTVRVEAHRPRFHGIMFLNCFCGRFRYADNWRRPPRRHHMRLSFL
ncbi:hypothetical protein HC256_006694 [Beauveria bassiana]|nr:hypothetical protein HC256_006619 [Beauveria bassiana]KAH8713559.1 hypothetical protein HC256_006694 [Beauveria bassiana]